jgi:hypothetical protein
MNQPIPTTRPPARQRRGIILVFVVVLLVLLAIMGTAYLATTRADLVTLRGRGAGLSNTKPLLNNRATLDSTFEAVGTRLKKVIGVDDVQSQSDHPAVDYWLSSLLPTRPNPTDNVRWPWISAPMDSTPLSPAPLFADSILTDPRYPLTRAVQLLPAAAGASLTRRDVEIGAIDLKATARVERARKYPGLKFRDSTGNGSISYLAGDADGDGIADSFLMPVVLNPTAALGTIDRYVDDQNGVIYYYSYRVVDNSAQINLGTALSKTSDFPINILGTAASDTDDPGETRELIAHVKQATGTQAVSNPNYGFFRSNVGLIEMLRESLAIYTGQTTPNEPYEKEIRRLIDLRYPGLREKPLTTAPEYSWLMSKNTANPAPPSHVETLMYDAGTLAETGDDNANRGSNVKKVLFRSFGDMAEQLALKHPTQPQSFYLGVNGSDVAMGDLASPPGAENLPSLHDKSGALLNSQIGVSSVENALWLSLRNPTPNYVRRSDSVWNWFPPDQVQLWYEWTKNLDVLNKTVENDPNYKKTGYFRFDWNQAPFNSPFNPPFTVAVVASPVDAIAGMTPVDLQRSIRSIVTTRNGVSASAPIRATPPPVGMPVYPASNTVDLDAAPYGEYPASKVSAATGTKRQLWRAYWGAMTKSGGAGGWDPVSNTSSFNSVTRYSNSSDADSIGGRNMVLIRSAIAAVNTIDLRDADDAPTGSAGAGQGDITQLDIALEEEANDPSTPKTKLIARVLGTEKRPYITEVLYANVPKDKPNPGNPAAEFFAVEIYNPHDGPIDVANYYIGLTTRSGTTIGNGIIAAETATGASPAKIGNIVSGTTIIPAGGYIIISSGGPPADVTTPAPGGAVVSVGVLPQAFATAVGAGNHELVLARRRRADNNLTTDPYNTVTFPNDRFDELADSGNAVDMGNAFLRMVPIETIDMQYVRVTLDAALEPIPVKFSYRRLAVDPASSVTADKRWRCVYGGQFFVVPLVAGDVGRADPATRPQFYPAWRKFESDGTTVGADGKYDAAVLTLGTHETPPLSPLTPEVPTDAIHGPPIQIQNFDVNTSASGHPVDRFPFGSPIARDVDILKVPFIGAYQIYRQTAGAGTPSTNDDSFVLLEQNALPMDAFLAEPDPTGAFGNRAVGRFDSAQASTNWAEGLFGHISARQAPAHDFYPDVPKVKLLDRNTTPNTLADDDTSDFSSVTTAKLAYVGNDGLVKGTAADPRNAAVDVVRYSVGGEDAKREGLLSEDVINLSEANVLIQGKINVNTAPRVVLRMLPWVVGLTTGLSGDAELADVNTTVEAILTDRDVTNPDQPFSSLTNLLSRVNAIRTAGAPLPTATSSELLLAGDLSGKTNQPTTDLFSELYNLNRVSNLITTRSDVYTVYYTVQAWTYRPNTGGWNQVQDTRLVGERRGAFVLDRSQALPGGSVKAVQTIQIANE